MLATGSPLRKRMAAIRETPRWIPRVEDLAIACVLGILLGFAEAKFHLAAYVAIPLLCLPFVRHQWTLRRSSLAVCAALLGSTIGAWFRSDFWNSLTETVELGSYGLVTVSAFALFEKTHAARVEAEAAHADTEIVLARLRTFCREVSHELRTPITISCGLIELVGERSNDAESQNDAHLASEELKRLSRLVDRLILVTASVDPDFLVPRDTDLEDLVSSIAQRWSAEVNERRWHLSLVTTEPLSIDQTVFAIDEERLLVALDCLIENAVFASKEDDRIEIVLTTSAQAAVIEVRDTGCGLSRREVAVLLESTSPRIDRPRRPGGTGLGLSVVQAIVRGHGGVLAIDSIPGSGTTFRMTLPRTVHANHEPSESPQLITADAARLAA
jgi:signal transduction histidine kinase